MEYLTEDQPLDKAALPHYLSQHPKAQWPFLISRSLFSFSIVLASALIFSAFSGESFQADEESDYRTYIQAYAFLLFLQIPGGFIADHFKNRKNLLIWSGAGLAISFFLLGLPSLQLRYPALVILAISFAFYPTVHFVEYGSFYKQRKGYLHSGVASYFAADACGAVIGSIAFNYLLFIMPWHQIFLTLAVLIIAGHVYLLQISKVYDEKHSRFPPLAKHSEKNKYLIFSILVACIVCFVAILVSQVGALELKFNMVGNTASSEILVQFSINFLSALACIILAFLFGQKKRFILHTAGLGILIFILILVAINTSFTAFAEVNISSLLISTVIIASGYAIGGSLFLISTSTWILQISEKNTCAAIGIASAALTVPYFGFDSWFREDPAFASFLIIPATGLLTVAAAYLIRKKDLLDPVKTEPVDEPPR